MAARTEHREGLPRVLLLLACAFIVAGLLSSATRSEAQIGCCYCDNCPPAVGPMCTDLMNSSASCVDLCIVQRGCAVLEFSPAGACNLGCGSKPPFFSPTPTATPTETITPTPTISATPTITATPLNTPTPHYCCQGDTYCRTANLSNVPFCPNASGTPIETPIIGASCDGNANMCKAFTPTNTATNTVPTKTPTPTAPDTPTKTPTPTVTQTPTIGGFKIDPYSCYRVKATKSSAAKGLEYNVTDQFGTRMKRILKPQLICNPSDVDFDDVTGVMNPVDHLTCYKIKDDPKVKSQKVTMRNKLDEAIVVDVIKGDLLCVPSYKTPPKANATATPTPSASVGPTNTP